MISGQADHTVPDVVTRLAYKLYGDSPAVTDLKQFPDRGHSQVVDHGWRTVALQWPADQDIHGRDATGA
ncbi:hypothetical protein [Streptomyces sp. R41]|uniref:Peptidase S9 prolyl oligopeptidase catalytic domain-containing protein n=1 Tax=Streptomyces sp. R41 TaxID=3238632 RepID=A0AB39RYR2_9ACTN